MNLLQNNYNYTQTKYTIPANSVYTVDNSQTPKNYYSINNMSNVILYAGVNMIPNESMYNVKIDPKSVAHYNVPVPTDELNIYNPSVDDVDVIIVSFVAEFNPLFSALGKVNFNVDGTIKTDGVIKSFETSLPAGNNKIGIVDLSENSIKSLDDIKELIDTLLYKDDSHVFNTINEKISRILLSIYSLDAEKGVFNLIYNKLNEYFSTVDSDGMPIIKPVDRIEYQVTQEIKPLLDNISNNITSLNDVKINNIMLSCSQLESYLSIIMSRNRCTKFYNETNTDAEQMYTFTFIKSITNDGESDINAVIAGNRCVIKPNEKITDIYLQGVQTVKIPKGSSYRIIGGQQ